MMSSSSLAANHFTVVLLCVVAVSFSLPARAAVSPCYGNSTNPPLRLNLYPDQPVLATFEGEFPDIRQWVCDSIPLTEFDERWLHNDSYLEGQGGSSINEFQWSEPVHLSDSGTYECQNIAKNADRRDLSVPAVAACFITHYVIRVIAPPKQYAVFSKPFSLQCDSNHGADDRVWSRHGYNGTIDGSFSPASLQDEGQYVCNLTVLGKTKTLTTELVVVVPAKITHHPPTVTELEGPNAELSVTVRSDYPGTVRVMWYRNGGHIMTENVTTAVSQDMSNSSSIAVSRRSESGQYRVVVGESRLPDGFVDLPEDVIAMATHYVAFNVNVIVPPAVPSIVSLVPTHFSALLSWTHTNQFDEDTPDTLTITVTQDGHSPRAITVDASLTNYTITGLTPAMSYSVSISATNKDDTVAGVPMPFSTKVAAPSVTQFSVTRPNKSTFVLSLTFEYLGAADITTITACYREQGTTNAFDNCLMGLDWRRDTTMLRWTATTAVPNTSITVRRAEFILVADNTANLSTQHPPMAEAVAPLSSPPRVSFKSISFNTADLLIELPTAGSPPITSVTVTVTPILYSARDTKISVREGPFDIGEIVLVRFKDLLSGTNYTVTAVAMNLVGASNVSIEQCFVTVATSPTGPVSLPTTPPIWVIILSSILPAVVVMALIITTCLFFLCIRKCRVKRKEYHITPAPSCTNATLNQYDSSPNSSRRYFDNNRPLTPRSPFADTEMTNFNLPAVRGDSDTESTNSHFPQYKYVVSPSPLETLMQSSGNLTPQTPPIRLAHGTFV